MAETPTRALCIRKPWCNLILSGDKDIELRSTNTSICGRVCIAQSGTSEGENLHWKQKIEAARERTMQALEFVSKKEAARLEQPKAESATEKELPQKADDKETELNQEEVEEPHKKETEACQTQSWNKRDSFGTSGIPGTTRTMSTTRATTKVGPLRTTRRVGRRATTLTTGQQACDSEPQWC